jgi:hypothetical protein
MNTLGRKTLLAAAASVSLVMASAAQADTLLDAYVGNANGYVGGAPNNAGYYDKDNIAGSGDYKFEIFKAVVNRVDANNVDVTVYTNYAGNAGHLSTFYGGLFFGGPFSPTGPADTGAGTGRYPQDVYTNGDWQAVFLLNNPASNVSGQAGKLYQITDPNDVTLSSASGIYRAQQPIGYNPNTGDQKGTGTMDITAPLAGYNSSDMTKTGTITFHILDNGFLSGALSILWAMSCANDVIAGPVGGFGSDNPVPLPPALILFLSALGGMVVLARRRRQGDARLALNSAAA